MGKGTGRTRPRSNTPHQGPPQGPVQELIQSLLPSLLTLLVGVLLDRLMPGGGFLGTAVPLGLAFLVTGLAYWPYLRSTRISLAWFTAGFAILSMCSLAAVQHYRSQLQSWNLPPNALLQPYIRGVSFRLADLFREHPLPLKEKTFEDCEIHGPGMLVLTGQAMVSESAFDIPLQSLTADGTIPRQTPGPEVGLSAAIVEVVTPQPIYSAVLCEDCTFRRCSFKGVQFIVPQGSKQGLIARAMEES